MASTERVASSPRLGQGAGVVLLSPGALPPASIPDRFPVELRLQLFRYEYPRDIPEPRIGERGGSVVMGSTVGKHRV